MTAVKDLTGQTFNRLTVLYRDINREAQRKAEGKAQVTYWMAECECGTVRSFPRNTLLGGRAQSCGCLALERVTKHGDKGTRLYSIWIDMKRRTVNPNRDDFHLYGLRGISVCPEWENDYLAFKRWSLANGYSDELTIDRIDNDGDYCPENCKWSTLKQQANNTRQNVHVEIDGRTQTIAQWADESGLHYSTVYSRYRKGVMGRNLILSPKVKRASC